MNQNWIEKWIPSVVRNPWLLSGNLASIENLITDRQARVEVGKAISLKMAKAYLEDLKELVEIGQFKLTPIEVTLINRCKWQFTPMHLKEIPLLLELLETIYSRLDPYRN